MKKIDIDKKVDATMEKLYGAEFTKENRKRVLQNKNKITSLDAPVGSLIVTPKSMSKKDFDEIQLMWVKAVEKQLSKKRP